MIFTISSELYVSSSSLPFPYLTSHYLPLCSPLLCSPRLSSPLLPFLSNPSRLLPSHSLSLPFLSSLLLFSRTLFLSPPHIRFVTPNHIQIDQLDLATVQEAITSQLGPDAIEVTHRHR